MPTQLDRILQAAGCKTQVELAEFLGIRQSAVTDARRRGRIPEEWLLKMGQRMGMDPAGLDDSIIAGSAGDPESGTHPARSFPGMCKD